MIFKDIAAGVAIEDEEFDQIYPPFLREAAETHFTPVQIAQMSAKYLVTEPGTRVLDIGSGAGKFCMVGAMCTEGYFTGVEKRESLHSISKKIMDTYKIPNVELIRGDIMDIDFRWYDAFYFYNSFFENMHPEERIDDNIKLERELYDEYSIYVKGQLSILPEGTRVVTYFSYLDEMPRNYVPTQVGRQGKLKFWVKVD